MFQYTFLVFYYLAVEPIQNIHDLKYYTASPFKCQTFANHFLKLKVNCLVMCFFHFLSLLRVHIPQHAKRRRSQQSGWQRGVQLPARQSNWAGITHIGQCRLPQRGHRRRNLPLRGADGGSEVDNPAWLVGRSIPSISTRRPEKVRIDFKGNGHLHKISSYLVQNC